MARGGYRPNAGRPKGRKRLTVSPAVRKAAQESGLTPLDYLLRIMRDPGEDAALRARAAALLLPFLHPRAGDMGKREYAQASAANAEVGTPWEELLPKEQ